MSRDNAYYQFYKNAPIGGEGGQGLPLRLTKSSKQYLKGSIRARSSKNCSSVGGRFIKGKNESFVLRECPVRPRSIKGKHVAGCICSASCTSANILHMYTLTHRYHRPRCQYWHNSKQREYVWHVGSAYIGIFCQVCSIQDLREIEQLKGERCLHK